MSEFNKVLLKEIAHSQTGPFGSQLHESDYVEKGTPIVTVEHLGVESFTTQNLPFVSDKDKNRLSKYILKEGDIVFSRVGSVDRCTYVSENEDGWMFSGRCIRVRPNSKVNSRFLSFYFRQDGFKKMMNNISVGATMPSLNTSLMDGIPISLPKRNYQDSIAKVLSDLDAKIEVNNKINAELEAMAKLIYDYWFVQFDFPFDFAQGKLDANGQPYKSSGGKMVYNEQLKREIPEGWEVKELHEVLTVVRGASPRPIDEYLAKDGLPWIKISDATSSSNRFIVQTKQFIKSEGEGKTRVLEPGALILSNSASPAIPRIVKIRCGIHDGWLLIKDFKSGLTKEFMLQYFKYERPRIINLGSGSIFKNLKTDYVKGLKIIIPPKSILENITPKLESISERIYSATKENQKLSELRDWLLPMLMNGQVTVNKN